MNITVERGLCYGFFGRNGAGKTTTMKCLLNLLRPKSGNVSVFGMDPHLHEVKVKSRISYVPDTVNFHSWMRVHDVLGYAASFRKTWNQSLQKELIDKFQLDPGKKANDLSKGQKMQLALIAATCPDPDLLLLDEPTSGLDPSARRDFIESVIGAYQNADPDQRTIFVSTHLITEFEGLIDAFTIIDRGKDILTMNADAARNQFTKVRALFENDVPEVTINGAYEHRRAGRELELILSRDRERILAQLQLLNPTTIEEEALSLEEIFLNAEKMEGLIQ
ncbi:MAG: ABC-2 type transport system ATP-binding protein [Verrucomicrobiales bacterium]